MWPSELIMIMWSVVSINSWRHFTCDYSSLLWFSGVSKFIFFCSPKGDMNLWVILCESAQAVVCVPPVSAAWTSGYIFKNLGQCKVSWHLLHMELSTCGRNRKLCLEQAIWLHVCYAICFSSCCSTREKGRGIAWPHSDHGCVCNSLGLLQPHEELSFCCTIEWTDKIHIHHKKNRKRKYSFVPEFCIKLCHEYSETYIAS